MARSRRIKARTRIAICCQGGGSQTAFTAGALRALLQERVHETHEIVTLTGTSGGAICAALTWYALRLGEERPWERLDAFWAANTAQTPLETFFNDTLMQGMRSASRGKVPVFQTSPTDPIVRMMAGMTAMMVRPEFTDLRLLLDTYIDFDKVAAWSGRPGQPNLLLGAVDILAGQLRVFSARNDRLTVEHILASCAVPNLFPAVELEGSAFWDGLFSDNPPVEETIQPAAVGAMNLPDEIWVIKINPTRSKSIPVASEHISDRRNQLIGNLSLFQQLHTLDWLNDLLARDAFKPAFLSKANVRRPVLMPRGFDCDPDRPWHIPFIEMSQPLQDALDYESKLDRNPRNINALIADGEDQARAFLRSRAGG